MSFSYSFRPDEVYSSRWKLVFNESTVLFQRKSTSIIATKEWEIYIKDVLYVGLWFKTLHYRYDNEGVYGRAIIFHTVLWWNIECTGLKADGCACTNLVRGTQWSQSEVSDISYVWACKSRGCCKRNAWCSGQVIYSSQTDPFSWNG